MTALAKKISKLVHYLYPDAASKRNRRFIMESDYESKRDMRRNENKTEVTKSQPTLNCKMSEKRRQQCNHKGNNKKETVPVKFIIFDPPTLASVLEVYKNLPVFLAAS